MCTGGLVANQACVTSPSLVLESSALRHDDPPTNAADACKHCAHRLNSPHVSSRPHQRYRSTVYGRGARTPSWCRDSVLAHVPSEDDVHVDQGAGDGAMFAVTHGCPRSLWVGRFLDRPCSRASPPSNFPTMSSGMTTVLGGGGGAELTRRPSQDMARVSPPARNPSHPLILHGSFSSENEREASRPRVSHQDPGMHTWNTSMRYADDSWTRSRIVEWSADFTWIASQESSSRRRAMRRLQSPSL
jgi:hypothetical protein